MREHPNYRTEIPPQALENVIEQWPSGSLRRAQYLLNEELVGERWFHQNGNLMRERCFAAGRLEGWQYDFYEDNGILRLAEPYRGGVQHGTATQFGESGQPLGTYQMSDGTGLDLWRQEWPDGAVTLAEVHPYRDGLYDGVEVWINPDQRSVSEERCWREGRLHGIERRWSGRQLDHSYPRFYIDGQLVHRRDYLLAAERDPTLPPYRMEDDLPQRRFPPEITAALGEPRRPVETLVGLRGEEVDWLRRIGIETHRQLAVTGVVEVYARLLAAGYRGPETLLYALHGAVHNVHWSRLSDEVCGDLRRELLARLGGARPAVLDE